MGRDKFVVLISIMAVILVYTNISAKAEIIGDGQLEAGEDFDYKILNIEDGPDGPAQDGLVFSNTDPDKGSNPFPTHPVSCRQYIKVVFMSNVVDARVVLYTDNKANNYAFTGRRTTDKFPDFAPTPAEKDYKHPYNADDPATEEIIEDGGWGFADGKMPIPVTGGMVGEYEDAGADGIEGTEDDVNYHDEVIPIIWQVDDERKDPASADFPWYDYDHPIEPDTSRPEHYRDPTDWWGFVVDKFALDWDWAIDWATGHFKTDPGNEKINHWVPTKGYRTVIDSYGNLGGFPGARNPDGSRQVDENGNPVLRVAEAKQQPDGSSAYEVYIYLGANLFGKHAQPYSTSNLILKLSHEVQNPSNPDIEHKIPAVAIYESGRDYGVEIKARYSGEPTNRLVFASRVPDADHPDYWNPAGTTNVSCRQYLEINDETNMRGARVVFYADNTHSYDADGDGDDDTFPQFTGRRTKGKGEFANFDATPEEETYPHPYPDAEHDLTEDEEKAGGGANFKDGLMPIPVTGGLVRQPYTTDDYDLGTDEVAPIIWQVYDVEKTASEYPEYIYSNPANGDKEWAYLMEKFSFDWDWAIQWADEDTILEEGEGHFKIDFIDLTHDPDTGWIPTIGYRTIFDSWGNLGSFPPKDKDGNPLEEGEMRSGESPVYLYLGASFYQKHAGTYKTERIILSFE